MRYRISLTRCAFAALNVGDHFAVGARTTPDVYQKSRTPDGECVGIALDGDERVEAFEPNRMVYPAEVLQ